MNEKREVKLTQWWGQVVVVCDPVLAAEVLRSTDADKSYELYRPLRIVRRHPAHKLTFHWEFASSLRDLAIVHCPNKQLLACHVRMPFMWMGKVLVLC
jgi:hypothetical protein